MMIKILDRFFKLITFASLRKKWHHLKLASDAVIGKGSFFHKSAAIVNAQRNRSNIRIGNYTHIRGELFLFGHGGQISIGDYCYVGEGTRIWSAKNITIGNNVLIAHNVNIHDNISHPIDATTRHAHYKNIITNGHPADGLDLNEKSVVIKDNAWIGFNATILKGVTIGERAVIGACSVVTKDVADDEIVIGNPAKTIGFAKNNNNE